MSIPNSRRNHNANHAKALMEMKRLYALMPDASSERKRNVSGLRVVRAFREGD